MYHQLNDKKVVNTLNPKIATEALKVVTLKCLRNKSRFHRMPFKGVLIVFELLCRRGMELLIHLIKPFTMFACVSSAIFANRTRCVAPNQF